jgi:hypothetical protein
MVDSATRTCFLIYPNRHKVSQAGIWDEERSSNSSPIENGNLGYPEGVVI